MHQCPVCPKSFPSLYKLQRHYVIHTGQKPFSCKVCGKAFTQSDHLKTHLEKVHLSKLQRDGLQNGSSINNQMVRHSNHSKPVMNTRSAVSSSVASRPEWKDEIMTLNSFLPTAVNGKNITHGINGFVLNSDSVVIEPKHQERVDPVNVDTSVYNTHVGYTCKVCFKSFTSSLQLWIHFVTHNKPEQPQRAVPERDFSGNQEAASVRSRITFKRECPKCLKAFCSPSKLQRHLLIHTGQKPYSCEVCWKAFRQKVHLKSHLKVSNKCSNNGKKQWLCNSSQTIDVQLQSLLQRPAGCHTTVNSAVELELQYKISVNSVQAVSRTEIKPDATGEPEQLLNTSSLNIHNMSGEQEQRHVAQEDLKPFRCWICRRSFRLEVNLVRHHKTHRDQRAWAGPGPAQDAGNNVKRSDAIKQSPEANDANSIDFNIVVKPETGRESFSDLSDFLTQDAEVITSAEHRIEPRQATSRKQRTVSSHQCHACSKCFPSSSKLQRHVMTHTGQRPFGCDTCGKRFRQKTHLRVHCRTHLWSRYHKQRSLYINRPPSRVGTFNARAAGDISIQEIFTHKRDFEAHNGGNLIPVTQQDRILAMAIVQTRADGELQDKVLPCTSKRNKVSNPTVKNTQTSKAKQNTGNAEHKCFQCFKCFPNASKLQRHEMVHTGLKPFQCHTCGKAFRQASHLKTHERSHLESRSSKPANLQGNVRKLKANIQQALYPRIGVCIPRQKQFADVNTAHPDVVGAVSNRERELVSTRHEAQIPKVTRIRNRTKSSIMCLKRKLHTCQICFKNFASPYKLSRHFVTHTGIRPYKCTLCSKTFTQCDHLKVHERRCTHANRTSDYNHEGTLGTNHTKDKCTENIAYYSDLNVDAAREQPESGYSSSGHYSPADREFSECSEAIDSECLVVPEVGSQEANNKANEKHRGNCDQARDHHSYSFPTELALEIDKLVQNRNMTGSPLSYQCESNNVETPGPCGGASDKDKHPGNQIQADLPDYWCEPVSVFDRDKIAAGFKSFKNTGIHLKTTVSPQKHRCDVCFKDFVSPSKLKRHYLIHTGQRPFTCDICGKTFTQSAHVQTHRLTH